MTKQIELTKGKVAIVDDGDFEMLSSYKWHAETRHGVWYARTSAKSSKQLMHKLIMGSDQVDHKDRNGLNNTRSNLRYCTQSFNNANRKKQCGNLTSTYKGVCLDSGRYWRATIRKDKKKMHLGMFKTEIEAARAYNTAARKLFGEFALLNDIGQ